MKQFLIHFASLSLLQKKIPIVPHTKMFLQHTNVALKLETLVLKL